MLVISEILPQLYSSASHNKRKRASALIIVIFFIMPLSTSHHYDGLEVSVNLTGNFTGKRSMVFVPTLEKLRSRGDGN